MSNSSSSGCGDIFVGSGERPETTAIKLVVAQWLWNTKKARIIVPEFRLSWKTIVDVAAATPKHRGWETHLVEVKISVNDLRRDIVTKADVKRRQQEIKEVAEIADAVWRQWVLGCRTKFGIDPVWSHEWYRRSYRRDYDWVASLEQQLPFLSDYDEISQIRRGTPPKGLPQKKVGKLADPWFQQAATFLWVATNEERVATKVTEKEGLDPVGVLLLRDGKLEVRRRAARNDDPWLKKERFLQEAARNLTQRMLQHAGFEVTLDGIYQGGSND